MAVTTPDAVPGELITAAWGDAVRADLAARLELAGGTMTGNLLVTGNPTAGPGFQARVDGQVEASITGASGGTVGTVNLWLGRGGAPAATGGTFIAFRGNAASSATPMLNEIGTIKMSSGSAVAYNTTSDPRTKTSGETRGIDDAAARAAALGRQAWRGQYLDPQTGQAEAGGETWDFLSSHDIEDHAGYAVTGERDAVDDDDNPVYQQVNYPALVPLLFAALADALDRIAALEQAAP